MVYFKRKFFPVFVATSLILSGCNQDSSSTAGEGYDQKTDTDTEFNQLAMVTDLTDNVITPTFENFLSQAQQQAESVSEYCSAEQAFANQELDQQALLLAQESAQSQWRATMNIWQQAELMLLGPLKDEDGALRNKIYSWPTINSCGVDYDVVYFLDGTVNGKPYDISLRTPSRKGLAALDYLLFNANLAHSCDANAAPPLWDNLTEVEQKLARCNFASEVAKDISNNAQLLLDVWLADNGYANKLKQAGTTDSEFATEHDAVNRISDVMFYLDSTTKDGKLAEPLGLVANVCGAQACPEAVESKYSAHSLANILNNLIGFEKLLTGNEGLGFVEYLKDVGDEETANAMTTDISNAITTINAYEQSLAETLANNPAQVEQTHADVKKVTDKLKIDFINSLALELPKTSAGDND